MVATKCRNLTLDFNTYKYLYQFVLCNSDMYKNAVTEGHASYRQSALKGNSVFVPCLIYS